VKLTHVRLLVDDVQGCAAFYRNVLGFEQRLDFGQYIELQTGDVSLGIFRRDVQTENVELRPPGDGALLSIRVDDLEQLRGIGISKPRDRPDWGLRAAYLRDPAGNLVELYEDIPPAG
jgi:lactoylglutathione lyase